MPAPTTSPGCAQPCAATSAAPSTANSAASKVAPSSAAFSARSCSRSFAKLTDTTACAEELKKYADAGLEVHVYGFGTGFNGAALKELVADQRGGSVKPICNEQDVIETFAHIAEVNHRLLGQEGALVVEFSSEVDAGDGWLFRPQERYLGPVRRRRFARDLGGVEAGRSYAALFELRLPPAEAENLTARTGTLVPAANGVGPETYRRTTRNRRDLMIFLKPTILRDQALESAVSSEKYNFMRARQIETADPPGPPKAVTPVPILPEREPLPPPQAKADSDDDGAKLKPTESQKRKRLAEQKEAERLAKQDAEKR